MLADEPVEVLRAVGTEVRDVFHTVSYVEANATQTLEPRDWKYATDDGDGGASRLEELRGLFGRRTRVSVDRYVHALHENTMIRDRIWLDGMDREYFQREGSVYRWKMNGMRADDVGVILDADETMSRDFLRAMQVCDVPEFRPGQDCRAPKVIALAMAYESSPDCAKGADDTWFHPDAVLGECVDGIGNASDHPPTRRNYVGKHGQRMEGYGHDGDYSRYHSELGSGGRGGGAYYPLWQPVDFRTEEGGRMVEMVGGSPTAYHFHNFFDSTGQIKFKYRTYGHAHKNAMDVPIWKLSEELKFAVDCARGANEDALDFHGTGSRVLPVYYLNDDVRIARHRLWQGIVREEEEYWNATTRAAEAEEEEDVGEDTNNKRKGKRIKNFQEKWRAKKALELRREERELRRARKRSKHGHI